MTSAVEVAEWDVPGDTMPKSPSESKVYLVPGFRTVEGAPAYRPETMILLKSASAADARLEYSLSEDDRKFVDFFSADVSEIEVWLALVEPITDILLFAAGYVVSSIAKRRGLSDEEAKRVPLKLNIAEINQKTGKIKGVKLKGNASDVLEMVRELKQQK